MLDFAIDMIVSSCYKFQVDSKSIQFVVDLLAGAPRAPPGRDRCLNNFSLVDGFVVSVLGSQRF